MMDKSSDNTVAPSNHHQHQHQHHDHHHHHHHTHAHEILDSATTNPQATQKKRKEKARVAARARRSQEASIITEMAKELHITRRIDKATIVKLTIDYIKAFEILCRFRHQPDDMNEIGISGRLSSSSSSDSNSNSNSSSISSISVSSDSGISNCGSIIDTNNTNDTNTFTNKNIRSKSNNNNNISSKNATTTNTTITATTNTTTKDATTTTMTATNQRKKMSNIYSNNNENNNTNNNNNNNNKRELREHQQQQLLREREQINQSSPKLNTESIFAPKTNEINSYYLMIGDLGFIFKSDKDILEEDDLTHLAPQAGDMSISLEADPLDDIVIDPELFENEIVK